ncbi:hypothetical protein BBJ28_00016922 [Nothophytophthora sp. Chile5]|nr:hypothetical protein BBJ28_00016922 [Nothophytophthora sp. Chile5]
MAKWGLVPELAFLFDVLVGLFLVLPLLLLSAFQSMTTIQTRMMYNGGFSCALCSGSEFVASLSVVVGGLGGWTNGRQTCLIFSLGYVNSSSDNFVNESFIYFNNQTLSGAMDLEMLKVYAAAAAVVGVIVSAVLTHFVGRRWTIVASCIVTFAGCGLVWVGTTSIVLIAICLASAGIAMVSLVYDARALCQSDEVVEEVQELKYSIVAKDGRVNLLFRIVLVVALQAACALLTSGSLLLRDSVQPVPIQSASQMSKCQIYYGLITFVGVVLSLLTMISIRNKTIFKNILHSRPCCRPPLACWESQIERTTS